MHLRHHFGPDEIYGIYLVLFEVDDIVFEMGTWDIFNVKLQATLFGLRFNLASVEIADTRISLGLLNCYLSVFWG